MGKSILFGVDLMAFGLAIVKLLVDRARLTKAWADALRAFFAAAGVLVVGLYSQGFLPGLAEPWFMLSANVLAVFLMSLGYMPEATGLIAAATDQFKQKALMGALKLALPEQDIISSSAQAQITARALANRYCIRHF